jgi:hypothetical protein
VRRFSRVVNVPLLNYISANGCYCYCLAHMPFLSLVDNAEQAVLSSLLTLRRVKRLG